MNATRDWSWVEHWSDLLNHDEVWCNAAGQILRLDDMDPGYCGRVYAFCMRQAEEVYDLVGMQACAAPEPSGYQAGIDFDRAFDDFLDAGDDPKAWLGQAPLLVALKNRAEGRPARSPRAPAVRPVRGADEDPFGPYEYVEPGDRCRGAQGECGNGRCTERQSSCRCMCPACCGDSPEVWGAPVY